MKRFVTLFIIMLCTSLIVEAQTYTEHIRKKEVKGQGKVTITQSAAIDELVNGKRVVGKETKNVSANKTATETDKRAASVGKSIVENSASTSKESTEKRDNNTSKKLETSKKEALPNSNANENSTDNEIKIPVIDTRKKVMRGGYKVDGYRVQAFAGGNSRADKLKAQQIGSNIKTAFPDQPIYVHFYSPRWICRVGNYRSIEEATRMLNAIQALGYKQAVIVKGKITVLY